MERRKPLRADPDKARAWQQRGAQNYAERRRRTARAAVRTQGVDSAVDDRRAETPPQSRSKNRKPRRNDAPWRDECLTRRGRYCRACAWGHPQPDGGWSGTKLEVDHIKPRGQGGPSVVENGLVLCASHHQAKTESRMVIEPSWLEPDQLEWLKAVGWVWWDADGRPQGRGWRHFAPMVGAGG